MDPLIVYTEFGEMLRKTRLRRGLTQRDLAKAMELSRTSITNIELGKQKVLLHQLYSLAKILGVNPKKLLPSAPRSHIGNFERELPKHISSAVRAEMGRIVASASDRET